MDNKISTLDIKKFRLPDSYMESCPKPPKKSRKPRLNDNFLKGPIPIGWLMKASALPGKASQIGVALWYLSGLRKNSTVILANGLLERFHARNDDEGDAGQVAGGAPRRAHCSDGVESGCTERAEASACQSVRRAERRAEEKGG